MTSEQTRCRILDTAERLFAEHGCAGTSARRITSEAEVDLGAVRYHFSSKQEVFNAVIARRLVPLCEQRLSLLAQLEAEWGEQTPPLEGVLRAYLRPALVLMGDRDHGMYWIQLMARVRIEPGRHLDGVLVPYRTVLERFLSSFEHALPDTPVAELAYRFYFLLGTEMSALIADGFLQAIYPKLPGISEDPASLLDRLVRYFAAGMRAHHRSTAPVVECTEADSPRSGQTSKDERQIPDESIPSGTLPHP